MINLIGIRFDMYDKVYTYYVDKVPEIGIGVSFTYVKGITGSQPFGSTAKIVTISDVPKLPNFVTTEIVFKGNFGYPQKIKVETPTPTQSCEHRLVVLLQEALKRDSAAYWEDKYNGVQPDPVEEFDRILKEGDLLSW